MSSPRPQEFIITGISNAACVARIERVLHHLPGVRQVRMNVALSTLHVTLDVSDAVLSDVVETVERAGFGIERAPSAHASIDLQRHRQKPLARREAIKLIIAVLLSLPLLIQMLGMFMSPAIELPPLVQWALATPIQLWCACPLYVKAWGALRRRQTDVGVLVALGTGIAYGFSMVALCLRIDVPLYFDTSAMIVTLVLLGQMLERLARHRAGAAIDTLLALRPVQAHVERGRTLVDVNADQLRLGDTLVVKPGEKLPADGIIIDGMSELDESVLSGESQYVCKHQGHEVFAATRNCTGTLRLKATRIGNDTSLARIILLVERAQRSKARAQWLADRAAAFFIPIVLVIALLTFFIGWGWDGHALNALLSSVSVLVIACPCALALATPTAVMAGTGRAAAAGLLFRHAQALEQMRHISTLVMDKTGTLTEGRPQVVSMTKAPGVSEYELLSVAYGVEQYSQHPLALAVVRHAQRDAVCPLGAMDVTLHPGRGVIGRLNDERVASGSIGFIRELSLPGDPVFEAVSLAWINRQEEQGIMVIGVVRGEHVLGYIGLSDHLRSGAVRTVKTLHEQGIHVVMLTGDVARVAARVAGDVGIDEVIAGVRPEEKAATIEMLRRRDGKIAMLGDGINDAPALATADVGIAIGGGADVSLEAADIILTHSRPEGILDALSLSHATLRRIYQNLFFAFFYNGLGIPLAALGLLNPVIAGAAMTMSSVSVIVNSLLLQRWQPPSCGDARYSHSSAHRPILSPFYGKRTKHK